MREKKRVAQVFSCRQPTTMFTQRSLLHPPWKLEPIRPLYSPQTQSFSSFCFPENHLLLSTRTKPTTPTTNLFLSTTITSTNGRKTQLQQLSKTHLIATKPTKRERRSMTSRGRRKWQNFSWLSLSLSPQVTLQYIVV